MPKCKEKERIANLGLLGEFPG